MSILSKLHGDKGKTTKAADEQPAVACPHSMLLPHWDSVDDMGKEDRVVSYHCESCGETFSAEEGRELKRTEASRLVTTS